MLTQFWILVFMFPIMGCLVMGGVSALTLGSHLVCELFPSLVSMADIANQLQYSSCLSPEVVSDSHSTQCRSEPFPIDWGFP